MNHDESSESVANDVIREQVRAQYGAVAEGTSSPSAPTCCSGSADASLALGYTKEDLEVVPEGANLGLGCGNPQALASLQPGEVVLDLGSGGGFDSFLAARQVGETGRVIGVDMTPAMISKARRNAETLEATNVEFRLGEIEHLPVADGTVDVILSNCVINLSPDKRSVFAEAFRVLTPGGRLAISDVVEIQPMSEQMRRDEMALVGCIAGAASVEELERLLTEVGFDTVHVELQPESREFIQDWIPGSGAEDYVSSAKITARRAPACCG